MSKYTTEVRYICETSANLSESIGFSGIENVLDNSWDKIFTKNWEIFDEEYRKILCKKILRHFYTREICAETVALWKLWLDATMCDIMQKYNKFYEIETYKFNPLYNVDITTSFDKTTKGNTTGQKTSSGSNTETGKSTNTSTVDTTASSTTEKTDGYSEVNKFNDTPQGGLSDIEGNKYLTDVRYIDRDDVINQSDNSTGNSKNTGSITNDTKNTSSETSNNTESSQNTEEWVQKVIGKNTSENYAKLLSDFRESVINIDNMIIHELEPLFFNLW